LASSSEPRSRTVNGCVELGSGSGIDPEDSAEVAATSNTGRK